MIAVGGEGSCDCNPEEESWDRLMDHLRNLEILCRSANLSRQATAMVLQNAVAMAGIFLSLPSSHTMQSHLNAAMDGIAEEAASGQEGDPE